MIDNDINYEFRRLALKMQLIQLLSKGLMTESEKKDCIALFDIIKDELLTIESLSEYTTPSTLTNAMD